MPDFMTADPPIENAGLIYDKEGAGSKGIYAVGSPYPANVKAFESGKLLQGNAITYFV